tara:strand:- start:934 stop:1830 length:897 start_codon:yes stop_codon:yes gene_type:complete
MILSEKISYNKRQAEENEWLPQWFGASDFNIDLLDKIKLFQKEHGLTPDGLCGPSTYRRMWTERDSEISTSYINDHLEEQKFIVHNSEPVPIKWNKVKLWNDEGGLSARSGSFLNKGGREEREPRLFVNHWDVCLSSKSCARVLNKRGLSVHFCIDNDGTIFQLLDTQHVAFHAGGYNKQSVGVEISNAYSLKYQNWYEKNGFGKRPIWDNEEVHGRKLKPFLGFYHIQLQALAALYDAVSRACDIPLAAPEEKTSLSRGVQNGTFRGFCSHFHLTKNKKDCAGLDIDAVLQMAKEIK